MSYLAGIFAVVVGFIITVGLHELGHLVPAKKFGAVVSEYAIGFGPKIVSREVKGTLVVFRAIPLGGYVRILGMFAPAKPGRRTLNSKGQRDLAEEARHQSAQEMPEGLAHRAFWCLTWWKKAIVMAAGPAMNFLLAFLFLVIAMVGIGFRTASLTLADVSATIQTNAGNVASPAYEAGLTGGDTLIALDGRNLNDWSAFRDSIASSNGQPLQVTFERDGDLHEASLYPRKMDDGTYVVGVTAGYEYTAASMWDAAKEYRYMFTGTVGAITKIPQSLWNVTMSMVTGSERDSSGLISIVGVSRIAGEVTSDSAGSGVADVRSQIAFLLSLMASLNMALAVFNLIPLPPLDGGHIIGALYEGVRGGVARMGGKQNPGPVDTARLLPLTWVVGALLAVMSIVLVIADIVDPLSLR